MIKYCLDKWEKNKNKLEEVYRTQTCWTECVYKDIVKAVVTYILNPDNEEPWDANSISEIDNGDYQGTLIYLIPQEIYQPSEYEYLITYVGYGSCPGCDTLQDILYTHEDGEKNHLSEVQIKDFMVLSKDIVMNIRKPYNNGWRHDASFDDDDDVKSVRHGKWINGKCSECGHELTRVVSFDPQFDLFPRIKDIDKTRYCPNCGAKMDLDEVKE